MNVKISSVAISLLAFFLSIMSFGIGVIIGEGNVKGQVFQRGYMIQCVNKTGYYWECDE